MPEQVYGFESTERPSECQPSVPPHTGNCTSVTDGFSDTVGLTEEVFVRMNK
jgi:hypothetical protein